MLPHTLVAAGIWHGPRVSSSVYWGTLSGRYFSLGMCSRVWSGSHSASIDIFVWFLNRRTQCYTKMIWPPLLTNITLPIASQAGGGFAFPIWQRRNGSTNQHYPATQLLQPLCFLQAASVLFIPTVHYVRLHKQSTSSFGDWRAINLKFIKQ